MKNLKTLITLLMILSGGVFAQPAELWMRSFANPNGTGTDFSDKSVVDQSGNIYMAGSTRTAAQGDNILVIKYNSEGTFQWATSYNHSYNGTDQSNDIALDNSGNIYVTGTSTWGPGGAFDAVLIKLDSNGNKLWVKRTNKTNHSDRTAEGVSVQVRDYVYLGVSYDYNGMSECGIVKFNRTTGDSLAYLSLGISNNYTYSMYKMVYDGISAYYVICGGKLVPNEEEDFLVKKINTNGNLSQVWTKTYTGANHLNDRAMNIAVGPDGNVFVTGYTEVPNQDYNVLLLKLGRDDGATLFTKTYNDAIANYTDVGRNICFDQNSNIYIGGYTSALNQPAQMLFLKYSPAGVLTWSKKFIYNAQANNVLGDMKLDAAGNIYTASSSYNASQQTTNLIVSKFSSELMPDWHIERIYNSGTNGYNTLNIQADGTLLVSGYWKDGQNMKTLLVKYGSTIGIQQISGEVPAKFQLGQNYPNPFNPVTNINFSVPKAGNVKLVVFDAAGKEVAELVNNRLSAGTYNFDFNASHLSSGVYFYKLIGDGFAEVKKMILVK